MFKEVVVCSYAVIFTTDIWAVATSVPRSRYGANMVERSNVTFTKVRFARFAIAEFLVEEVRRVEADAVCMKDPDSLMVFLEVQAAATGNLQGTACGSLPSTP